MVTYGTYSVEITNDDTSKSIFIEDLSARINKIIIKYDMNIIPTFYMEITSIKYKSYYGLKNITCVIKVDDTSYTYKVGINKIKNSYERIQFRGYLCKREDFIGISTAYLGDSLESAVLSLGIRDKINGELEDTTQNYWMIQESKTKALKRILRDATKNGMFTINYDSINIINFNNLSKAPVKPFIPFSEFEYFSRNSRAKELEDSGTNIVSYNDEMSNLTMHTSLGRFYIDVIENETSLINKSTSLVNEVLLQDTLLKVTYKTQIPDYEVGDVIKVNMPDYYEGDSVLVTSQLMEYNKENGIIASYLLTGLSLED